MKFLVSIFAIVCMLLTPLYTNTALGNTATSITYKGNLPSHQNHTYTFSNSKEGILNVNVLNNNVDYTLLQTTTETVYVSGDILPAGEYQIILSPQQYTSVNYEVTISGDVSLTGQTTLPSLNITSPSAANTRLSIGDFDINYSGSSNGSILNYVLNHNSPINLSSSFSKNLNLIFGLNNIGTHAELANKNYITDVRTVVSPGVLRLSGPDRFDTAVAVSKEIQKEGYNIETVIITNGYNFADGLPGVVLGHKELAPILTTRAEYLPDVIKNEIIRLGAKKAIILGGTGSVSSNVQTELVNLGLSVERISGADRYEVSTKIAEKIIDENASSAIIVNGDAYMDALMISPYAGNTQQPILYTRPSSFPAALKTFLDNHPNINQFTIIGGTGAVSEGVEAELAKYGSTYRVSGADRYQVGINIGYGLDFLQRRIVLVSNESDGVPAALLSSLKESQMMLTSPAGLPPTVKDYITGLSYENLLDNIYIVGGTGSVPQATEDYIRSVLK
ncbi:cell wall-binding repeat-containing protein [Cytobacillus pseudoceanisediminis]|nr:cell wall-binding repeat-containing protein [Cytobacillus oceanisediminis]